MLLVGLTGGIGAGKSSVARLLAERGAIVLDADAIVRALQEPGTEVHRRIVDVFGEEALHPDGTLDRARIAEIVFRDEEMRARLTAITHPEVYRVIAERLEELKATDAIVVLDVPLLVESGGGGGLDVVIVVDAPEEERVQRVVRARGGTPEQVRMRMAVQASAAEREALADIVIRNDGDEAALRARVDDVWRVLEERRK